MRNRSSLPARFVVRNRGWIALLWLAIGALLLPFAGQANRALEVAARIPGSESARVEEVLATEFASPFSRVAVLVLTGLPAPERPEGRALLGDVLTTLEHLPDVTGTFSYLDVPDTLFTGGNNTFAIVGLDPRADPADEQVVRLRRATADLLPQLQHSAPGARLRWTGESALNADLRQTSATEARAAERRILPVTLLLLLFAFGTLVAAGLPVAMGVFAIPIALGAAVLLSRHWPLSVLLVNIVSMVGLGLGIDYGLLVVSRFREALARGYPPTDAAEDAARHAGHTVLLSGATVAIGFGALLLVPLNEIRSVAVGGALVVAASVLLATTLLPGLLAWLGPRVDWGRVGGRSRQGGGAGWRRWGRWVAAYPGGVLLAAGLPVLLLAAQALRLNTELPRGNWLPPGMESALALRDLDGMGRGGIVQTVRVVLRLPSGTTALEAAGYSATRRLAEYLSADPHVERVQSLPTALRGATPTPQLVALLPAGVLRSFVGADRDLALIEVLPRPDATSHELAGWVRELRSMEAAALTGLPGAELIVGGIPATNADYEDTITGNFPAVLVLVLTATLLALLLGFRALFVSLKAVLLNLLSVAAAFGALVLVFQDGYGAALLGLDGGTGGVFPAVPILVFCTVFGLSMDYEVFLVARVAEARRAGMDETDALAEGLARTGGVITRAAAIMIAVFGAFTLGDFLLIKMLGFALAVAVLIDATVVRLAIGPALLRLAGQWNWWPGNGQRFGR